MGAQAPNIQALTSELLKLKKEIAESVRACDMLQGKIDAEMARLKRDFGHDTIEAANSAIVVQEQEIADLGTTVSALLQSVSDAVQDIRRKVEILR